MKASKGYKLNAGKTGCIDVNECEEKLGCQGIQYQYRGYGEMAQKVIEKPSISHAHDFT